MYIHIYIYIYVYIYIYLSHVPKSTIRRKRRRGLIGPQALVRALRKTY